MKQRNREQVAWAQAISKPIDSSIVRCRREPVRGRVSRMRRRSGMKGIGRLAPPRVPSMRAGLGLACAGWCGAALLLLLPSCAGRRAPEPLAPPRPRPGYDRLVDDPGAVDTLGLRGRRIVLDPGHGGFFR